MNRAEQDYLNYCDKLIKELTLVKGDDIPEQLETLLDTLEKHKLIDFYHKRDHLIIIQYLKKRKAGLSASIAVEQVAKDHYMAFENVRRIIYKKRLNKN